MALPHRVGAPPRSPSPSGHIRNGVLSSRPSKVLIPALMAALALSGCGDTPKDSASMATASTSPSPSASPSATASPTPPADRDGDGLPDSTDPYPDDPKNIPQQPPVTLMCDVGNDWGATPFTVNGGRNGLPDFTQVWAAKPTSCDSEAAVYPVTDKEKAAYKTSAYDDGEISVLYEACAEVDPDDAYNDSDFAASAEQIPELNAILMLCPTHPYAKQRRQAVQRGQADADLEAQGRLFGPGTYRVGKEIKPGTYVTTDVEGCYWARQNSSGGIIDNYFTNSARRVQVTIRSSDYAFSSEGCGEWRPAR